MFFLSLPAVVLAVVALYLVFSSFFTVRTAEAAVIARFGKFLRVAQPGLNWKVPLIDQVQGRVSLRVTQIKLVMETKTQDNVFVSIPISVQTQVRAEKVYDAFYKLADPTAQIQSYVEQVILGHVPGMTLDAVFAFVALHFAKVPMIREFGYLLAVGIAVICLTSIVVPLSTLGIREFKSPTRRTVSRRSEALGRVVVRMGSLPRRVGGPLIAASLVIFVAGIIAEPKLQLQTDPIEWVNQDSQVIHDIDALQKGTGSSNEFGVFVTAEGPKTTVFSQPTVDYVDTFTADALRSNHATLRTANSVVSIVSDVINDVPGAGHVTPTVDAVRAAYELAPAAIQKSFATDDGRAMNVIFRTGTPQRTNVDLDDLADVVHAMEARFAASDVPPGLSLTPSGLAVVGVGLLENLESNRVLLTYLSIAFVALYLAIRLRSVVRSLLSLIPVLIAVGLSSLAAFALDLKLSPLTAVGGPLVVAICTEFTSLILLRFVEERGRGFAPRQAMDHTAARTGRAFIVSALTAVSGVAVIATSSMPLLRDFGIIVGMNVLVALLSALVFLPPMLVWAESGGRNWISRHLIPHEVLDAERERLAATDP